jgi:hypothetical protein
MERGDFLKLLNFLDHQRQIAERPEPCPGHVCIPQQRMAAEIDAAVGFGWGHEVGQ